MQKPFEEGAVEAEAAQKDEQPAGKGVVSDGAKARSQAVHLHETPFDLHYFTLLFVVVCSCM